MSDHERQVRVGHPVADVDPAVGARAGLVVAEIAGPFQIADADFLPR